MAKPNRGKTIKRTAGWRGTCPVCKRKRLKILWPYTIGEQKVKICKKCSSAVNKAG